MVAITHTKFTWLDSDQRTEFRKKWQQVMSMADKWAPFKPGDEIKVFAGKKDLEDEIKDLEDLSLAAYRALKLLRKQLAEGSKDDEYENEGYTS